MIGAHREDAVPDDRVPRENEGEERKAEDEAPLEALTFRKGRDGRVGLPVAPLRIDLANLGAEFLLHRQVAADVERLFLLGPGVAGGHHGLERFAVGSGVVIGLHEVLGEDLPVKGAVPFVLRDHDHVANLPRGDLIAQSGVLLGHGSGRGTVEIDEDKTVPNLGAEGAQAPLVAVEALGLSHFGAGLELAVEFEGPEVVGAKEKAGVTAAGFALLRFGGTVAVVAEARRHDVHGAVRTDAREHVDSVFFIADDDDGFAEDFNIEEVADVRDLGNVAKADPVVFEEVVDFPIEERLTGVGLSRQGLAPRERQVGDALKFGEDFGDRHGRLAAADGAAGTLERIGGGETGAADIGFGNGVHEGKVLRDSGIGAERRWTERSEVN